MKSILKLVIFVVGVFSLIAFVASIFAKTSKKKKSLFVDFFMDLKSQLEKEDIDVNGLKKLFKEFYSKLASKSKGDSDSSSSRVVVHPKSPLVTKVSVAKKGEVKNSTTKEAVSLGLKSPSLRQSKILEVIKSKKNVKMADIASVFKNVTTRTLRRDLDELVGTGSIVKSGKTKDAIYKFLKNR